MLVWDLKYFLAASSTSADNCPASPAQFYHYSPGKSKLALFKACYDMEQDMQQS